MSFVSSQSASSQVERFATDGDFLWSVIKADRPLVKTILQPWLQGNKSAVTETVLKDSKRRRVVMLQAPGWPAIVVKRYPAKTRFPENLRDWLPSRAGQEFAIAQRFQHS